MYKLGDAGGSQIQWLPDAAKAELFNWDPYYSIFKKDGTFLGAFTMEPMEKIGEVAVGLLLHKKFQEQRFGSEIAKAAKTYIDALRAHEFFKEHVPIHAVVATAHPDNIASCKLQEAMGFQFIRDGFIQDSLPRKFYRLDFKDPLS